MSIEYFVEGKILTQTEGNNTTFSKEGIVHNSTKYVNQKGADTGVSYNSPKTIHPNDKPINTVDVSLNLFFDGTFNNKTNVQEGKQKDPSKRKGSYDNDFSNVARGYDAIDANAENQISWYIEGIGTVDSKTDNDTLGLPARGGGLGVGERGIAAKVTKGCIKGAEALRAKYRGKVINVLTVNVYGFSRGAAAARHFMHVATNAPTTQKLSKNKLQIYPPEVFEKSDKEERSEQFFVLEKTDSHLMNYGYFGACLLKNELVVNQVKFNFVGLYDTVASFGINHKGFSLFGVSIIDSDAEQLGLNAVKNGSFVFQIASADEYRDNFSLSNIESAGIKGLQITLPGVHSDIGGGYVDKEKNKVLLYIERGSRTVCDKFRKILIEEGWFKDSSNEIWVEQDAIHPSNVSPQYKLWGERTLSNHYDKVSLFHMFEFSKQFNVKYNPSIEKDNSITDNFILKISSQLLGYIQKCNELRNKYVNLYNEGANPSEQQYVKTAKEYSYLDSFINMEDLKKLRREYLHWSSNMAIFGMGPRESGALTNSQRKRYIIDG